jgi:nitrite reductase (NADH) large subunit
MRRSRRAGLWPGRAALRDGPRRGIHLAGDTSAAFVHSDTPTKLKVTGIELYSLGDFADGDDRQEIVLRDATAGVYKRLVLKDNRIIGTVLYGETADGAWFNDLKKKPPISRRCATR